MESDFRDRIRRACEESLKILSEVSKSEEELLTKVGFDEILQYLVEHQNDESISPSDVQDMWVKLKKEHGWKQGPRYDICSKEDPRLTSFEDLSEHDRIHMLVYFSRLTDWISLLTALDSMNTNQEEKAAIETYD